MKLWGARVLDRNSTGTPGEITEVSAEGLAVQTGRGTLLLTEIQMPSSRRMTVDEYLRGNLMETGYVLGE